MEKNILHDFFNYVDQDQDGLISFQEVSSIFEEIQQDASDPNLKFFFVIDDSDDSTKIGFEIFSVWFSKKINDNNTNKEKVFLTLQNYLKEKIQTQESNSEQKDIETYQNHYANITFGDDFIPKTQALLKLFIGEEANKIFEEQTKGFSLEKNCGIVFTVKTKNPIKAEESIKHLIPRFLPWLNEILPSKSTLDFKQMKATTYIEEDILKIFFEPENKVVNEFIEQYKKAQSRIIPEGLEGMASLEVNFKKDFDLILKEEFDPSNQTVPKKGLLNYIFEGASVRLKGSLTESILNNLRNDYLKSKTFSKLPQGIKNMAFLLLWKSTKIEVSFKKFRASFLEEVLPKGWDLGIEKLLTDLKEYLNPLQKKYAMLKAIFLISNKEFIADFNISVKVPGALATLEVKTQGVKEIYDYISLQN